MLNKRIINLQNKRIKLLNYKKINIDNTDKRFNEEYIDIKKISIKGFNYYNSKKNPPYLMSIPGSTDKLFLRENVSNKLELVNKDLSKLNLELYVYDAFRPIEVQNYLWFNWFPKYLLNRYPNKTKKELIKLRDTFTSKGSKNGKEVNLLAPPPHSTGGAVDLTLKVKDENKFLNMGTPFDDFTKHSYTDYYETKNNLSKFEKKALINRRILYWVMKKNGFENYPNEWWHFSIGDQMWANLSGNSQAYYTFKKPEQLK